MAKISIRDASGNPISSLDFGDISANGTTNALVFRVYNNYDNEPNVGKAYDVKVGLVLYDKSKVVNSIKKPFEGYIIKNGIVEIDCTISSKLDGGYPNVDWTPIKMSSGDIGYFYGTEFDEISAEGPNNFNEYKVRLNNFPNLNWAEKKNYSIFIRVIWDDKK